MLPLKKYSSVLIVVMLLAASITVITASDNAMALDFVETMTVPWPSSFEPLDSAWDSTGNHAIVVGNDTGQSSNAWHYNSASGEWAQVIPAVLPPVILYVGSGTGNYSATIQAAIDAASAGDAVYVWPGTYYENVVVNKAINLTGASIQTTVIHGNNVGITLSITASWANVTGFTVTGSGPSSYGVKMTAASNCTFNRCLVVNNYVGMDMSDSHDNIITRNNISDNSHDGLFLGNCDRNVIRLNDVCNNAYGISIETGDDNKIYHNNIIANVNLQAYDHPGTNTWNMALLNEGNYWSDWTSPDADGNGIVDVSYSISGDVGGQDNFPWTLQDGWNIEDITLSGEWHFDENAGGTAYDSSHNSYDGVLMPVYPTNNPIWMPSSVSGSCLHFDGIDDAVETDYIANTFNAHDFTIQAWIYPMVNTSYMVIYGIGAANVQDQVIEYKINLGRVEMWYWMDNWASSVFVNMNEWTHLTYTHSTSTKTGALYVNGVYRDSHVFIANPNVYSDNYLPSQIGHGVESRYFSGNIDEVKIWARTLSPEEIQQQYDDMTTILIHNVTELQAMNNGLGANYVLANDIDASETISWNGGLGFKPVGTPANPFTGDLDGSGHMIIGLNINRPAESYVGMFGVTESTSTVKNLHLVDANVAGADYIGAIVGYNNGGIVTNSSSTGLVSGSNLVGGLVGYNSAGTVSRSYSTVTVNSTGDDAGGLVGYMDWLSTVAQCYSNGAVNGKNYVGGLVGQNCQGTIDESYTTASVQGNIAVGGLLGLIIYAESSVLDSYSTGPVNGVTNVGGFIGDYSGGTVTNCFWDLGTSGMPVSGAGVGQTATAMMTQTTFTGWDFTNTWWMLSSNTRPFLRAEWSATIRNSHQLQMMYVYPSVSYSLACDIDLADVVQISQMWGTNLSSGAGFVPVGTSSPMFTGTFQGNNQAIRNLYTKRPSINYQGLFGCLDATGKVYNVTLENVNVTGYMTIGGLVGYNYGLIQSCHVSGKVLGFWYNVGGITGYNTGTGVISRCSNSANITSNANNAGGISGYCMGSISESFSTGVIRASIYAGGLGGYLNALSLTNCYATGDVTATTHTAGGLGAYATSGTSIINSYSTGFVTSPSTKGGLIGSNPSGSVTSSFWDTETSGLATSAGGTGKTTTQMKTQATFTSAGWDFADTWHMSEGKTYPLFAWQPLSDFAVHYGLNGVTWDEVGEMFWLCGETGGDSTVYYIDPQQSLTTSIPIPGAPSAPLRSIATDNLGNVLVGGTSGDTIYYYDGSTWQEIYSENPMGFEALAMDFNPNDGRFYLAGYEDSPAVMAFYYTDPVPLIGGGTFHRYQAPGLTADVMIRSVAWNDLHDYGIAVGDSGQVVKVWPYSYYGNGTMHYENITSPVTNDYYDISWDTDDWNEAAIVGQNQTYGNYWRYYDTNPKLIQGYKASLSGTLYRTCAFKPPSSPKWVMIPYSSGGVKINVDEKYEGGEIIITLGTLGIYSTKMYMAYDVTQADLFNMPIDAGSTYTFAITCNYSGNWNSAVINLTAWHDRGALGDTSQPLDWNANNRTKQFNITYSPVTNTTTMHYPIPENGVSEFSAQTGWYESGTGIDGNWYKVYITVNFGPQTTAATGAMNSAVDIHDMNMALNDRDTWDVCMQLTDMTDPASFDRAYNEFGVKKYAWISNSGTPKGSAPPGATNVHLSSSFINYSTNSNHSVTISIPDLYLNGYLGSPYSITVDRLAIQNLAGTVAYSDTADMPHPFPGPNLPMYIWGKSAGPVLISAPQNGTSSAGPVTDYSGGGTAYTVIDWWLTAVPVSAQEGMYMGTITVTLGY